MTACDLDQVQALAGTVAEAPRWSQQEYERILPSVLDSRVLRLGFVAESNAQLVAFAVIRLVHGDETAELETIVVDPKHRRRGVGSQLLSCSMREAAAAGASAMHLEVRASNATAIAFYERSGFRRVGRRASYYSAPSDDAIVFAAQLTA